MLYVSRACRRSEFRRSTCAGARVQTRAISRRRYLPFLPAIVRASRTWRKSAAWHRAAFLLICFSEKRKWYLNGRINSFELSDIISWLGRRRARGEAEKKIKLRYGDRDLSRSFHHVRLNAAESGLRREYKHRNICSLSSLFSSESPTNRNVTFVNMVLIIIANYIITRNSIHIREIYFCLSRVHFVWRSKNIFAQLYDQKIESRNFNSLSPT